MSCTDLAVSFPARGVIRLSSHTLFGDTDCPTCRRFIERVFQAEEVSDVTITAGDRPHAELRYCPKTRALQSVVNRVASFLRQDPEANGHADANGHSTVNGHADANGHAAANGYATANGHASSNGRIVPHTAEGGPSGPSVAVLSVARNRNGVVRDSRPVVAPSGWQVKHDRPGRLRLKNSVIYRKSDLCQAIERELMTVLGVEKYKTGSITCSVQVDYDPRELPRDQMVEILDSALDNAEHPTKLDKLDLYTRRLRRPIDGPTRAAIANEYSRRRHEIPVPTELQWHPDRPQFTIRAQWLSFVVRCTHDVLEVDAELSLAAKAFATQKHRQNAVRFIDSIAKDLGLGNRSIS
jgi:Cu2+-exporting ATPase